MSVPIRGEARRFSADTRVRDYRNGAVEDSTSVSELVGDFAEHAQGVVRAEVRLALEQAREQVSAQVTAGVRRVAFYGGAALCGFMGMALLLFAAVVALATVVALWLAALIVAALAFAIALALAATAGAQSAASDTDPAPGRSA